MRLAIHNYAEILAFTIGFIMLTRLRVPMLKLLVAFLFLTVLVELSSLYLTTNFIIKHSTKIYNFYIGVLIIFFLFFLFVAFKKKINKKITTYAMFVFLIFYIININGWQKLNNFNYFSYLLGALFLIILSCMYFFELLGKGEKIFTNSFFWIASAVLFFFSSTFVYFLFWYFLVQKNADTNGSLFMILIQIINVIFYLLIIVSFLCQLKKEK